jgi:preprotein translocase subunit SecG
MKSLITVLCLTLAGCGTLTGGNYILVSKGQADGLGAIFSGGVEYCKITSKGEAKLAAMNSEQIADLCNRVMD